MKKIVIIIYCSLMICCSTLPKRIEPQSLQFAQMKMKYANDAQKARKFTKALTLCREAYNLYTEIDNIEGKINSGISIARQYFYLNQYDTAQQWLDITGKLINTNLHHMKGAKDLLLMEMAFAQKDFKKVLSIPIDATENNCEWFTEALCYIMVSKSKLNEDFQPELKSVQDNLKILEKKFHKRQLNDPEVLSFSYYYVGYILSVESNWLIALNYFEKAKEFDGLIDNPNGVAKALYSMGQCYEKLNNPTDAVSCFSRAAEIYALLGDVDELKKAKDKAVNGPK